MPRHEWVIAEEMTVRDIDRRDDLVLVDADYDVAEINEYLDQDYGCYFVKLSDGDYAEVYAITGTIPYLNETLYKLELREVQHEAA